MSKRKEKKPKDISGNNGFDQDYLIQELQKLQMHNAELLQYQQYFHQQMYAQQPSTVVVQCPGVSAFHNPNYRNIFLGGSISEDDWQKSLIDRLHGQHVCIYNPRRENWKAQVTPTRRVGDRKDETDTTNQQFTWELEHMEKSNCVVFWFPWDVSTNPGMFLQLGRCSLGNKAVFVAIHSRNKDKKIIYEFVKSTIPQAFVTSSVEKLGDHLLGWITTGIMPESNSQGSHSDC